MDQTALVTAGHKLVDAMARHGLPPRAAMWVHNTDTDTWRLWIVPPAGMTDKRDFYRQAAVLISEETDAFSGLDVSDIEMVSSEHPALKGLSREFRVKGRRDIHISSTNLNGFYLPDGIILEMNL